MYFYDFFFENQQDLYTFNEVLLKTNKTYQAHHCLEYKKMMCCFYKNGNENKQELFVWLPI